MSCDPATENPLRHLNTTHIDLLGIFLSLTNTFKPGLSHFGLSHFAVLLPKVHN